MKYILIIILALTSIAVKAEKSSKQKETAVFLVSMTCESCQNRIENNISFEKGVTGLKVDLHSKTVTIEYRPDKTTPQRLKEAINKLGFTAMPMKKDNKDKQK